MAAHAMALEPASSRYRRAYTAARDAARDAAAGAGRKGHSATEAGQDQGVLSFVWADGGELEIVSGRHRLSDLIVASPGFDICPKKGK